MSEANYPSELETVAVLRDGVPVQLRPIRPEDAPALDRFHKRQSPESVYFRFFRHRPELSEKELTYFTNIDYDRRMAFVAMQGDELVAVSRYEAYEGRNEAEVAFFVDDANHGRGLATLMLEYLAAHGRRRKFENFTATVLPENYRMLSVFRRAGFEVRTKFADGVIDVFLGIDITPETSALISARARQARAASVARILKPASIAVVGVGRRETSIGRQILERIVGAKYQGTAYAIHPDADDAAWSTVEGVEVAASLSDLAEPVDLVIVAVPADAVGTVVDDAVLAKAGSLLIVSAGFSDAGPAGAEREAIVVRTALENGLRVVGPNAFGVANTADDVHLTAMYIPVGIEKGVLGVASQSGPLGGAVLNSLNSLGVGISSFLGLGNQADIAPADVLQYWATDEATEAVAVYLDEVGDARSVANEVRVVSEVKPVLWVRPDNDDLAEVLSQAGVILVDRVSDLAEMARLVVDQPVPEGRRVAVVSNASSVGKLAVAACRREGLEIVVPTNLADIDSGQALVAGGAESISLSHNIDLASFERIVIATAVSEEVDAVVVALSPTLDSPYDELAVVLGRIDRAVPKPLVAVSLAGDDFLRVEGMPTYAFPEEAAAALGRYARYGEWRRTHGEAPFAPDDDDRKQIVAAVDAFDEPARISMLDPKLGHLFDAFGLALTPYGIVGSHYEARQRAASLGFPVVLKAGGVSSRLPGEAGGVALDLRNDDSLLEALGRMEASFGASLYPVIVQKMVEPGIALKVELEQSAETGSLISVSLGGNAGALAERRVCRALPASIDNLQSLTTEPWLRDLLADEAVAADLVEICTRLVAVGESTPAVRHLCLDPILVAPTGVHAVEGYVEIVPPTLDHLADMRHL